MGNLASVLKTRKQFILDGLNDEQIAAVVNYEGPAFIIAAPGSGKTRTIISRTAYMIEDGVEPGSIIMFTFTNKAAMEMKDRVQNFIGARSKLITVGTYHSICGRLLRKYCSYVGMKSNFTIYDEEEKTKVLKKCLPATVNIRTAIDRIGSFKEDMLSPSAAMQRAETDFDRLICQAYEDYQRQLRANNAMDFDDLIYYMIRILQDHEQVRKEVNAKYSYIIADEMQDSSPRDVLLIEYLAGDKLNLCTVADDEQSIYGFRGAKLQAVFDLEERINPTFYKLECNYRSTGKIVESARSLIEHNEGQYDKEVYTLNKDGYLPVVYECPDPEAEAAQVVKIVKGVAKSKKIPYNEMAVLYRTSYLSRDLEQAFLKNSVPYVMRGGTMFYARKEIKDLLAYLRLLFNPCDMQALNRIWNVPKRNLGEKTASSLSECYAENLHALSESDILSVTTVLHAVSAKNEKLRSVARQGLSQFVAVMEQLQALVEREATPREILEEAVTLIGYEEYLEQLDDNAKERMDNLKELMRVADCYINLEEFLYNSTLHTELAEDESTEKTDAVQFMTMHSSKGLEFSLVVIVGANNGVTPHRLMMENQNDIEEERRLFYVAMTRAKEFLFITRPVRSFNRGMLTFHQRSMFLDEIDQNYLKIEKQ